MLIHIFFILFLVLLVPTATLAQQASMVWDEATKSWVSTPAPTVTPPTPTTTTQPQTQIPQTYVQQPQQAAVIPVTAGASTVDLGTLATIITPILAGIAGMFVKNRKDMEKSKEEVKAETIKEIQQALEPKIKQITPVAEQTAKQDVKIAQLAEEMYKIMAEKANEIHDKPEIQQTKLIEDTVKSKMIAEQSKEGSMVWDDKTNSWISK